MYFQFSGWLCLNLEPVSHMHTRKFKDLPGADTAFTGVITDGTAGFRILLHQLEDGRHGVGAFLCCVIWECLLFTKGSILSKIVLKLIGI